MGEARNAYLLVVNKKGGQFREGVGCYIGMQLPRMNASHMIYEVWL